MFGTLYFKGSSQSPWLVVEPGDQTLIPHKIWNDKLKKKKKNGAFSYVWYKYSWKQPCNDMVS